MQRKHLKDIQSEPAERKIPINQVGVKDIRYPVIVMDRQNGEQHTIAKVNMYVELPHHFRGTHMSRFIEILNRYRKGISTKNIDDILQDMQEMLEAERAFFEMEFPYFIMKEAPISKEKANMEYICRLHGDSAAAYYTLEVEVPVLSLCPCSKEISEYGAHNQRSIISIRIEASEIIWIEEIISLAEQSASSEIYSILKREDEKYVTEQSYKNPMFVEDMVRHAAHKLMSFPNILAFSVESENHESIHKHSAYARITKDLRKEK
jgi:GTP cyclohydrolase I